MSPGIAWLGRGNGDDHHGLTLPRPHLIIYTHSCSAKRRQSCKHSAVLHHLHPAIRGAATGKRIVFTDVTGGEGLPVGLVLSS